MPGRTHPKNPAGIRRGDRVYTPDWCAADMVAHFRPSGRVLEAPVSEDLLRRGSARG